MRAQMNVSPSSVYLNEIRSPLHHHLHDDAGNVSAARCAFLTFSPSKLSRHNLPQNDGHDEEQIDDQIKSVPHVGEITLHFVRQRFWFLGDHLKERINTDSPMFHFESRGIFFWKIVRWGTLRTHARTQWELDFTCRISSMRRDSAIPQTTYSITLGRCSLLIGCRSVRRKRQKNPKNIT